MKSVGGRQWSRWQRAVTGLAIGVLVVVSGFVWRAVTATVTITPSWTYDIGYGTSAPAVADGVVYVLGGELGEDRLYALDAATGKQRWTHKLPRVPSAVGYSDPVVAEGVVYTTDDGRVYALDAATGEQRWISETSGPYVSVTLAGGVVYVRNIGGDMYALDAATGEQRWTYEVSDGDYYPDDSVVADGVVYLDDDGENTVHALDAVTGEQRWTYAIGSGIYRPVVADGVVYISTSSDKVHAVRAATG
ncbi:PQQ-binding-like beta-propeller repeat protein [Microbispora sp. GKU 823]|uniref:PQQ-binding-like beta-propeller repeat protein n=1 Tax=Microbispora sp. GKU 823 TaxID=1652100 RepID=UPI0009D45982|nr:PQQ-binding-like beta-propeller repeat protein [Microbispora sp. GKU 823]OPG13902.1 hypothetical protein B1L11_05165 [Microbispora sp. GKU 823]